MKIILQILCKTWTTSFIHNMTFIYLQVHGRVSPPLAQVYRWEGEDFGKTYGIKARCYWEHPWETHWELRKHIGNPLGIWKEHKGNMLGTKEKWKKSLPPPRKNQDQSWVHAESSHWLHEISISKLFVPIFVSRIWDLCLRLICWGNMSKITEGSVLRSFS